MPRVVNGRKIYSPAEKAAYYKRKANANARARVQYKPPTISGKGDYRTTYARLRSNYRKPYKYAGLGRRIGSALGGAVGGFAGNAAIGNMVGGALGQGAHALVKTITGYGDYSVSENALVYNRDAVPQFTSANPRCTILTHSEFVRDIKGSTNFQLDSFNINASNAALFPWLSQIARNYEQIVWQGLIFEFKTTSATAVASTNTALGTVVMATQYDVLSERFLNKQQMENYEFAQSAVPSQSLMHAIECDPKLTSNQGLYYVDNPSNSNSNADPRLYNIGRFNLATVGMQAISTIGELWVSYKVCLIKPRQIGNNNLSDQWILDYATMDDTHFWGSYPVLTSSSSSAEVNTPKQFNPIMSDQSFTSLNTNPWNVDAITGNRIYINPAFTGQICLIYQYRTTGGTGACNEPGITVSGKITEISDPSLAIGFAGYDLNGSVGGIHACAMFQVDGGFDSTGVPTIIFSGGLMGNTISQASLAIFSVANNLRNPSLPA